MTQETSQPNTLRVFIIRHGETEWSRSGQYTGRTDIPLTTHGEAAAREVGERLRRRNVVFTTVLTSPLQRAKQTCALAGLTPAAEIDSDLTEWDNGDYEGHASVEIHAARPGWNLFHDGAPNGESPARVAARADHLIARLCTLTGNVALFTHGHFGRVLGARWIGLPAEHGEFLLMGTASISMLAYEHNRSDKPAIALWNNLATDDASKADLGT